MITSGNLRNSLCIRFEGWFEGKGWGNCHFGSELCRWKLSRVSDVKMKSVWKEIVRVSQVVKGGSYPGGSRPRTIYICLKQKMNKKKHNIQTKNILRWPGIEPGSTAWKAAMLTIIPPTLWNGANFLDLYSTLTNCDRHTGNGDRMRIMRILINFVIMVHSLIMRIEQRTPIV